MQAQDVCILDLLNIPKPLPNSCFSENQINLLFNLWREFMYERFRAGETDAQARNDVEKLFSDTTTVQRKYLLLALDRASGIGGKPALPTQTEASWVMSPVGNANFSTPFVEFLQQNLPILSELRMSFKPILLHSESLKTPDMIEVIRRYEYWLHNDKDRSVSLLAVIDESETGNMSTDTMVGNLKENFANFRYHTALLSESGHWRAVLIDKKTHKFEYYDPLGMHIDITTSKSPLASKVLRLYETARALDEEMISNMLSTTMRGFHHQTSAGKECGMYVLFFIHCRVALGKTFREFAETEIVDETCDKLKPLFFTLTKSIDTVNQLSKQQKLQFGAYDVRLAGVNFLSYIRYVISIITDQPMSQNNLNALAQNFETLLIGPGDYNTILSQGMQIQKQILDALPLQIKTFAGNDIWYTTIQEVIQDPLTAELRKTSTIKGKRSHNTLRKARASQILNEIIGWAYELGAPPDKQAKLKENVERMIDRVYVPVLLFDKDNQASFTNGMRPQDFLRECMRRQETVSFGVAFMRRTYDFVISTLSIPVQSELATQYAVASLITKPVTPANMASIQQTIDACQTALKTAYELLKHTFSDKMLITNNPSSPPLSNIDRIITENRLDMEFSKFNPNALKPFNFPLNIPLFHSQQVEIKLPDAFNAYSVTNNDMHNLLQNREFMIHYAMAVMLFTAQIQDAKVTSRPSFFIIFYSLIQFYNAAVPNTDRKAILCYLLATLYKTCLKTHVMGIESLLQYADQFIRACDLYKPWNETVFIDLVVQRHSEYLARL